MRNLVRHIDLLLRDNDCVILPGFGGFIAHAVPAYYVKEEHTYYPPSRSISFNAAITMNDGLLAQSYMKSYGVDYARATYLIDVAIDQLRDVLDEEGVVELPRIGCIKQDIHQALQFTPEAAGIASSAHFGLGSFSIKELSQLYQVTAETIKKPESIITHTERTIDVHINKHVLRQVLYTAAVFLLLLMVALPTGTEKMTDIASLHFADASVTTSNEPVRTEEVVIEVMPESLPAVTDLTETVTEPIPSTDNTPIIIEGTPTATEETPVVAEESQAIQPTEDMTEVLPQPAETTAVAEVVPAATEQSIAVAPTKTYHIIVASLPSRRGADETLNQYVSKGYTSASLVERDNRVRISLIQFTDKDEANEYLKTLRENEMFQNAWLLAVRNN